MRLRLVPSLTIAGFVLFLQPGLARAADLQVSPTSPPAPPTDAAVASPGSPSAPRTLPAPPTIDPRDARTAGPPPSPVLTRPHFVGEHWATELPLVALTAALTVGVRTQGQVSFSGHAPDSGFHQYDEAFDTASYVTGDIGGALIGIAAGSGLEYLHLGDEDFLYSSLIAAEALLIGTGLTRFIKQNVGRCRPIAWDDATGTCDVEIPEAASPEARAQFGEENEAYQAMPSGHVASISAVSGAYFWLALRSPEVSLSRWIAFGVTQAMAWSTVGLRIGSGAHSPSDTIVSWGLNSFVGISVAAMHGRSPARGPDGAQPGNLYRSGDVSVRLVPHGQGLGIAGTF